MAVWTFVPQDVYEEGFTAPVVVNDVGPRADVAGVAALGLTRTFLLNYTIVTSEDCQGMAAFYRGQRGSFIPFAWINPNDQRAYFVRFEESMRLELFTPVYFRSNGLRFVSVDS